SRSLLECPMFMSQMLFMSTIPVALLCASMEDCQSGQMRQPETARRRNNFEFYWHRRQRWPGGTRVRPDYPLTGKIVIPPSLLFCGSHRLPGISTLIAHQTYRSSTTPARGMMGMAAYQ